MNAWITIDNPAEQDVALECLQNDWRLFANKDCDTAETPQDNVYFEVKRPDWTDVEGISGSSYAFCNGDSLTYKNLPAGKYQLRVVNQQNQETAKMANLKLRTFAKTAALGMTSQAGNTYM
jgi:FtsP/CotA-like multicopper oxidase with cupredoxin domain